MPHGRQLRVRVRSHRVRSRAPRQTLRRATAGALGLVVVLTACRADGSPDADEVDASGWIRVEHRERDLGGNDRAEMLAVTTGGPGFVAAGYDGDDAAVWTSSDGERWSRSALGSAVLGGDGRQVIYDIAAAGPGLVAVGADGFGAAVWTSPDGSRWTRVAAGDPALTATLGLAMFGVAPGGPGLVAVGAETVDAVPAAWASVDGTEWTRVASDGLLGAPSASLTRFAPMSDGPPVTQLSAVVAGGPGLVAVGEDRGEAGVWVSTDGLDWQRVADDDGTFRGENRRWLADVVATDQGLVAVGYDGDEDAAAVWTSSDGLTWTRLPHDESELGGSGTQSMRAVVATETGLVAAGGDAGAAAVWSSPDGTTWTRTDADSAAFNAPSRIWAATADDTRVVAVGAGSETDAGVWIGHGVPRP